MSINNEKTVKKIVNIKKTRFEYEIINSYKAGVCLQGWMIKSIRAGRISASDGVYVHVKNGELFLLGLHLTPMVENNTFAKVSESPSIKLLLKKSEINKLIGAVNEKGHTIVLKSLFWERHLVKADIALAKGKNVQDKRLTIKERDAKRDANRAMKNISL